MGEPKEDKFKNLWEDGTDLIQINDEPTLCTFALDNKFRRLPPEKRKQRIQFKLRKELEKRKRPKGVWPKFNISPNESEKNDNEPKRGGQEIESNIADASDNKKKLLQGAVRKSVKKQDNSEKVYIVPIFTL